MSRDMKAACLLLCISILMLVFVTPNFVEDPELPGISPRYFPNFATIILGCSSLLLIFNEIRRMRKPGGKKALDSFSGISHRKNRNRFDAFRPFFVAAILLIYFYLFEYVGFVKTTPFIIAALMVTLNQKNLKVVVISSLVVTFLLYELFDKGLGLPLH